MNMTPVHTTTTNQCFTQSVTLHIKLSRKQGN